MRDKIIKRLRKPLTIDFINQQLRSKGIATNPIDEYNLIFKLYDMNWRIYCENARFRIHNSFDLSNDSDMESMIKAANELNNDRFIIKAFVNVPDKEEEQQNDSSDEESIASIIFSFESFCYSDSDFTNLYEFAIYAITDGIQYHRKCYVELISKKKANESAASIGFHAENSSYNKVSSVQDNHKRTKIGFV